MTIFEYALQHPLVAIGFASGIVVGPIVGVWFRRWMKRRTPQKPRHISLQFQGVSQADAEIYVQHVVNQLKAQGYRIVSVVESQDDVHSSAQEKPDADS